jgi:hypothetical protein
MGQNGLTGRTIYYRSWLNLRCIQDGSSFMDHDVHAVLKKQGFKNVGGEWFRCTVDDVKKAIVIVRNRLDVSVKRDEDFPMRPEQVEGCRKN